MKTLLIAGIGNIFHGDDAFGCEVARAAAQRAWPDGVRVTDFGIRGYDLAFAIEGGWDAVILVDATPRGQPPGTVYLIEPALSDLDAAQAAGVPDAHGMNPVRVLEMVKANGGTPPRLFLVGCEPAVLDAEDFGLSEPVAAAVPKALDMIQTLAHDLLREFPDDDPAANAGSETA